MVRPDGSIGALLEEEIRKILRRALKFGILTLRGRRHKTELFYQDWREWIRSAGGLIGELDTDQTVSQSHAPFYNVVVRTTPIGKKGGDGPPFYHPSWAQGAGIVVSCSSSLPYCPDTGKTSGKYRC